MKLPLYDVADGETLLQEYAMVPAYSVKRLLGEKYAGQIIPKDAVYYWAGTFYPCADLAYDADSHTVTMPDGYVGNGSMSIHIYGPKE